MFKTSLHHCKRSLIEAGKTNNWDLDRLGAKQRAALKCMAMEILRAAKSPEANLKQVMRWLLQDLIVRRRAAEAVADKKAFLKAALDFAGSPRLAEDGFGFIRNILDVSGASEGGNRGAAFCNFGLCRSKFTCATKMYPVDVENSTYYSYDFNLQDHGAKSLEGNDYLVFGTTKFVNVKIEDWLTHFKPDFLEQELSTIHESLEYEPEPSLRFEVIALIVSRRGESKWLHQVVLILDYKENSYTFYDSSLWTGEHVRNSLPHVLKVNPDRKRVRTLNYVNEPYHFPLQYFEIKNTARLSGSCIFTSLFVALACVAVGVNTPESISVVIFEIAERSPERLEYGIRRFTQMMIDSEDLIFFRTNKPSVTSNLASSGFPEMSSGWQWLKPAQALERETTRARTRGRNRARRAALPQNAGLGGQRPPLKD